MKRSATLDHVEKEGHGDENFAPSVTKGTFIDGGGTYVDVGGMKPRTHSSNTKSGHPGGVTPLS